ncbi:MAG: hypothetical protein DRG78_00500 [Epsilonproteobacteria bacterium]|nr:MAG: hypothetical protein DRG78_00500 [Campylobacterota bacterium]
MGLIKDYFNRRENNFKKQKEIRDKDKFDRGFSWAASELLSGNKTVEELTAYGVTYSHDEFDKGIDSAVHKWEILLPHINYKKLLTK